MTEAQIETQDAKRPRNIQSLIGLALAIVGGVSYYFLLCCPWIRAYGVPNMLVILVGVVVCFKAVMRRRNRTSLAALGISVFIGALFVGSLYYLLVLPGEDAVIAASEPAPEMTLPNQNGEPVSLSSYEGRGPVLLVFYRGFW